jgi:hypothetical protein
MVCRFRTVHRHGAGPIVQALNIDFCRLNEVKDPAADRSSNVGADGPRGQQA